MGLGWHGRYWVLTDGGKGMPLLLVAVVMSNGEQAFEAFGQYCLAVCRREREGEIWLPCERETNVLLVQIDMIERENKTSSLQAQIVRFCVPLKFLNQFLQKATL